MDTLEANIRAIFTKLSPLSGEDGSMLKESFEIRHFKKGDFFVGGGQVCHRIGFRLCEQFSRKGAKTQKIETLVH